MKATYDNSFCMAGNCIYYFEDSCMLAMAEKGVDIEPYNGENKNGPCKEFRKGTFLQYVLDLKEDDFE